MADANPWTEDEISLLRKHWPYESSEITKYVSVYERLCEIGKVVGFYF
jgi:hypothetical protein